MKYLNLLTLTLFQGVPYNFNEIMHIEINMLIIKCFAILVQETKDVSKYFL